ncbi:hypothetical protein ACFBZI_08430 [Moraxella sp. ZJ142]|uniref:hypothetical protein n=1 Tax=Moraxella marmotae TaxID=3344520 RepID=UPI0035D4DE26
MQEIISERIGKTESRLVSKLTVVYDDNRTLITAAKVFVNQHEISLDLSDSQDAELVIDLALHAGICEPAIGVAQ